MSFCTMPIRPVKKAVVAPMNSTKFNAVSLSSNSGDMRATMKMPAVTMVAAWISAEIGVGPSIEAGSHTCSGTRADLPIAPTNRTVQITVALDHRAEERREGKECVRTGRSGGDGKTQKKKKNK